MIFFTFLFILMVQSSSLSSSSSSSSSSFPMNVWPKPRAIKWAHPQARLLSPAFSISTGGEHHRHLAAAASRCLALVRTEHHRPLVPPPPALLNSSAAPLRALVVDVADLAAALVHGADESYTLAVPADGDARLRSRTAWGAMRGLETFAQLVWGEPSAVAAGIEISDEPKFGHRGVMLDTARNFYAVEDILRTIAAMGANKLNVFHWHITDSQSFPLVLPSEPELAARGSYGSDMQYSPEDVKRVVEFGFDHGVRVMPEIDAPGHTLSWGKAYPDIVTCANMFWWPAGSTWEERFAAEPGSGQLNPLNPNTYRVHRNVMTDIARLFPDPFLHAGADEVVPNCWRADPTVSAFLSNGGTLGRLLETFLNNTLPHILSLNKTAVYWEDVLLDPQVSVGPGSLPRESTVLQTWNNGHNNTKRLVSAGFRVIVSSAEFYYLDCGHGDFTGNNSAYDVQTGTGGRGGSWCGPFKTWQTIYNYDIDYGLTRDEARLVLGGEVALWSEQSDRTVLDSRLWPRAAAAAEALWSGNRDESGRKRTAEATDRLAEWRSRMVARGVGAEPIQPLWCVRNPGMCNTAHPII